MNELLILLALADAKMIIYMEGMLPYLRRTIPWYEITETDYQQSVMKLIHDGLVNVTDQVMKLSSAGKRTLSANALLAFVHTNMGMLERS